MQISQDLAKVIADYLDVGSVRQLSRTNHFFRNALSNNYFLTRETQRHELRGLAIRAALAGIDRYLAKEKKHPGWVEEHWTENYNLKFDKGFHRAHCFHWILSNDNLSGSFKLLAIYALLNEKNGERLKANVVNQLRTKVGFNFIKKTLLNFYHITEVELKEIKDVFIKAVLNEHNEHAEKSASNNDCVNEDWVEQLEIQVAQLTNRPLKHLLGRRA